MLRAGLKVRAFATLSSCPKSVNGFIGAIGNTPLIRINSLSKETGCDVFGKAEFLNPGGSVKDRAAIALIEDAEKSGALKAGGTVVEGTAGNTGIGLAHVCRAKGYKCVIYIPDTQSLEKIDQLRILGADVRPVPAVPYNDPNNFNHLAKAYAEKNSNTVWTNQFDNVSNREAHYRTTGPEIFEQMEGRVDGFTCATGTGGTFAGISKFLKEKNAKTKVYVADPPGSVIHGFFQSGKLERVGGSITEGIGQGRITANMEGVRVDGSLLIEDSKTIAMVYKLLHVEGIYLGASSCLNVVAAYELAKLLGPGHRVATILCDGAGRYASRLFSKKWLTTKNLYNSIPEECRYLVSLP